MRLAILYVLVLLFAPVAVARPKWGLYGYIFFSLARPDILAYAPSSGLSMILAVATLVGSAARLSRWFTQLRNPFVLLFMILLAFSFFSTVLAVVPDVAYPRFWLFFRASILAIAIPVLLDEQKDLANAMLAIVVGLDVIAVKYGLFSLVNGGVRYSRGYGGMLSDNNTMALALVMGIPLAYYLMSVLERRYRLFLLGSLFFLVLTMVATYSRGAALSFGVVLLAVLRGSKHKVLALVTIGILSGPAIILFGSSYFDRIESIGAYDSDTSIRGRLNNAEAAFHLWRDHPLHGVGFGNINQQLLWPNYVPSGEAGAGLVVHNTYMQLLTDSGILGFGAYVLLLFSSLWWLGRSARNIRRRWPGEEVYPRAFQASLLGCAIGTIFLSRVDFDLTYILLMCTAAWWSISQAKMKEPKTAPSQPATRAQVLPPTVRTLRPMPAAPRF